MGRKRRQKLLHSYVRVKVGLGLNRGHEMGIVGRVGVGRGLLGGVIDQSIDADGGRGEGVSEWGRGWWLHFLGCR